MSVSKEYKNDSHSTIKYSNRIYTLRETINFEVLILLPLA